MMAAHMKHWLLAGALAITLLLVWKAPPPQDADNLVQPRRSTETGAAAAVGAAPAQFALVARAPAAEAYVDLFAPRVVKLARATAPHVEPAKPMPPPLPFTFVGKMVEEGRPKVFLQEGDTMHAVAEGDLIGRGYKVLGIENGRINLLYLPLDMTQTISVGNRLE